MALFKKLLTTYHLKKFEDDYLVLQCSKEDMIKAPFDGEVINGNTMIMLKQGDYSLYIRNIKSPMINQVKAGDVIGTPIVGNVDGRKMAYIMVKLYKGQELQDIIKYLNFKDKTVEIKEVANEDGQAEYKPKTTSKKSNKKKRK